MKKITKFHKSLKLLLTTILSLFIFLIGISALWASCYGLTEGIITRSMIVLGTGHQPVLVEGYGAMITGLFSILFGIFVFLASLGVIAYLFATYDSKR